jgi:sulfatase modifying factor 1
MLDESARTDAGTGGNETDGEMDASEADDRAEPIKPGPDCGGDPCGPVECDQGPCGPLECWTGELCVSSQARVPPGYLVDSTEVTRAQYLAWIAMNPSTLQQDPWCAWNEDYGPALPDECPEISPPTDEDPERPVVCVDWCDAYAYCNGVGKRLCGKVGGGPASYGFPASASDSQWYNACSSSGQHVYPYGEDFDVIACCSSDNPASGCFQYACRPVIAGSLAQCASTEPGYTGVYDMSANVGEWEDSCEAGVGENDACRLRGGSVVVFNHPQALRCDADGESWRSAVWYDTGFRCCGP